VYGAALGFGTNNGDSVMGVPDRHSALPGEAFFPLYTRNTYLHVPIPGYPVGARWQAR